MLYIEKLGEKAVSKMVGAFAEYNNKNLVKMLQASIIWPYFTTIN